MSWGTRSMFSEDGLYRALLKLGPYLGDLTLPLQEDQNAFFLD